MMISGIIKIQDVLGICSAGYIRVWKVCFFCKSSPPPQQWFWILCTS